MSDTLNAGQSLAIGQQLQSQNGKYILVMQADGNLVQYEGMPSAPKAVFDTGTWSLPPALRPIRAEMQANGNFVLSNGNGAPVWVTGTKVANSRLMLQDDRNLVIYDPSNKAVWAHNRYVLPAPAAPAAPAVHPDVKASKAEDVGWGKRMETEATLYRNGQLAINCYTANNNWWTGLRGQVMILVIDAAYQAIWVSQIFHCTVRCSIPDVSCASFGRDMFSDAFPAAIGQYAERLEIYHADGPSPKNLRDSLITTIKAGGAVAKAVMDEWKNLQ